jgi:uncharacterized protein (TIGR03437 family)
VPGSLGRLPLNPDFHLPRAGAVCATLPLPITLGGLTIRIGDIPAPIAQVSPGEIWVQIPWELPLANTPIEIDTDSPFGSLTYAILLDAVEFFFRMDGNSWIPVALHEDLRGLVSQSDPAVPNEEVQFYMTGLGPVSPVVPLGEAAPVSPAAIVIRPLQCAVRSATPAGTYFVNPVTEFAGLAPGLAGVYQVNLRMPQQFDDKFADIICGPFGEAFLPVRPNL